MINDQGFSIFLSREDWGIIYDALIEHTQSAKSRKETNSESTSDIRSERCEYLLNVISQHCK